eukprot:CAMPEP_0170498268 /NCGR_PEP_ID=MMETSP0208-20121228/27309_1 /TAXON_ID=197538 /ORGANISM="Strombidium inclinatum, Strain S3" /LENGTH=138 /DNA_ID=CAMNT_0010775393 /DNA_START=1036 /DNA_END=1449 /DNA_ORIENTATION=+
MVELVKKMEAAFIAYREKGNECLKSDLFVKTKEDEEFNVFQCLHVDSLLTSLAFRPAAKNNAFMENEIKEYFDNVMKEQMDNGWLEKEITTEVENFERILELNGDKDLDHLTFFFKPKPEKARIDLDICTNFEHQPVA